MNSPIIGWVLAIPAILLLIAAGIYIRRKVAFPYRQQDRLMTKAESFFFTRLTKVMEPRYRCHCCVRVADLIAVHPGFSRNRRALYMITSKHCDFVISSPDASTIFAAIELDDKSHERPDRVKRDIFLDNAFKSAGLPLFRFKVSNKYNFQGLLAEIEAGQTAVMKSAS